MALEYRGHRGDGRKPVLTECPACGHAFGRYGDKVGHIAKHSPEDFGLTAGPEGGESHGDR